MKLRNLLLGGAVALSAIMVSCKEDEPVLAPNVSVSPTSGTLGTEAGSVTLSLTATREWSATVEGDNTEGITVNPPSGSGSNEPVTVTVAAEANPGRTRTVTIVFSCGGKEAGYTLTQEGEMGNKMTIEEVLKAAEGATVETSGLVVAVNARGFIIEDDTDCILVYEFDSDGYEGQPRASIGDQVDVTGTIGKYSGRNQIVPTSIRVTASDQTVTYPASPVVVSSENYSSLELFSFVEMTGRYAVSGEYHNIYIDGITDDVDGSISYPMEEIGGVKLSDVVGHNITVRGYYTGGTSHLSVVVVSVVDNGAVETDEMTIAEVIAAPANSPVETSGKVMAVCKKGFIIADENDAIYVYENGDAPSAQIGNTVTVSGTKAIYNSGHQIISPTVSVTDASTAVPDYGEPVDLTSADDFNAYQIGTTELVKVSGTLANGMYVDVDGGNLRVIMTHTIDNYDALNGKQVTVLGYAQNYNTDKTGETYAWSMIAVSVEAAPYISVSSQSVSASATSAQFEVASNVDWTVSCDESWITDYTESGSNNGTISVSFSENSDVTRTAEFTITGGGVTEIFTLTQGEPVSGAKTTQLSFLNWTFDGASDWSSTYEPHTVEFDVATVEFESADKQSSNITDCPVTKGKDIELIMKNSSTMSAVTFNLKQWATKAQTASLYTSTDGGNTYSPSPIAESSDFTLKAEALPTGTNAVKVEFSSTSNQVGLASIDLTYIE